MPTEDKEFYKKYVEPNSAIIGSFIGVVLAGLSSRFLFSKTAAPVANVKKVLENQEITQKKVDVDFSQTAIEEDLDTRGADLKKLLFSDREKVVPATKISVDKALTILRKKVEQAVKIKQTARDRKINNYDSLHFLFELSLHLLAKLPKESPNKDALSNKMDEIVTLFSSHRVFQINNRLLLGLFSDKRNSEIDLSQAGSEGSIETQDIAKVFAIHNMVARSSFYNNESFCDREVMGKSFAWALFSGDLETTKDLISIFCEKHCNDESKDGDKINSAALREFISCDGINFKMSIRSPKAESLAVLELVLKISDELAIRQNDFGDTSARAIEDALCTLNANISAIESRGEIEKVSSRDVDVLSFNTLKVKMLREYGGKARSEIDGVPLVISSKAGDVAITDADVAMIEEIAAPPIDENVTQNLLKLTLKKAFPRVDDARMERNLIRIEQERGRISRGANANRAQSGASAAAPTPSPAASVEAEADFRAGSESDFDPTSQKSNDGAAAAQENESEIEERLQQKFDEHLRNLRERSMAEVVNLEAIRDELEVNLEMARTAEAGAKEKAAAAKIKIDDIEAARRVAQSERDRTKAELKKVQGQLDALKTKQGDAKKLIRAAAAANTKVETEKKKVAASEDRARELANLNADLTKQKAAIEFELATLRKKFEAEKARGDGFEAKLSEAGNARVRLEVEAAKAKAVAGKQGNIVGKLRSEVTDLRQENDAQRAEIASLKTEATKAKRVNRRVETLERGREAMSLEVKTLRGVARATGKRAEALQAANAQGGERAAEVARLKEELETARKAEAQARTRVDALGAVAEEAVEARRKVDKTRDTVQKNLRNENAFLRAELLKMGRLRENAAHQQQPRFYSPQTPRGGQPMRGAMAGSRPPVMTWPGSGHLVGPNPAAMAMSSMPAQPDMVRMQSPVMATRPHPAAAARGAAYGGKANTAAAVSPHDLEARRQTPPAGADPTLPLTVKTVHHNGVCFYVNDPQAGQLVVKLSPKAVRRAGEIDREANGVDAVRGRVVRSVEELGDDAARTKSEPSPRVARASFKAEVDEQHKDFSVGSL